MNKDVEWRNFIIPVDKDYWLSLGQYWDEDKYTVSSCEVALFQGDTRIGEPVRYVYAEGLTEIIKAVLAGDYTLFTRQYLVELDLFDVANDA